VKQRYHLFGSEGYIGGFVNITEALEAFNAIARDRLVEWVDIYYKDETGGMIDLQSWDRAGN
jgi:hypothetical protein